MKKNRNSTSLAIPFGLLLATNYAFSASTLIDYTFDGIANDVGPAVQVVENNVDDLIAGSANTGTGVITAGTRNLSSPVDNTHAIGFNSSGLVSLTGYTSFTATFEIDSISLTGNVADLLYNGMFFGVVGGTDATGILGPSLWNNNPDAFGYLPGGGSYGSHLTVRNAGSTSITTDPIASAQPSDGSLKDGFTFSLTVSDDNSWSISSTGLSTELSDSGTIAGLWSEFSGGVGLYTSIQGEKGGQLDMGRMTLTGIPEPSSAVLFGVFNTLLLLRRRRS